MTEMLPHARDTRGRFLSFTFILDNSTILMRPHSNSGQLPLVGRLVIVGHLAYLTCATWINCGTLQSSWIEDQVPGRVKSGDW